MTSVVIAVDPPRGDRLAAELEPEGVRIVGVLEADAVARAPHDAVPGDADVLVLQGGPTTLTDGLASVCRARGTRIVALGDDERARSAAAAYGLAAPLPLDVEGWVLADFLRSPAAAPAVPPGGFPSEAPGAPFSPASRSSGGARPFDGSSDRPPFRGGGVAVVWGPHGSPGRSTLAIELAAELGRGNSRVALVDADSTAPSIALALGLADEGPGFAAACRQAELTSLDGAELTRISTPVRAGGGRFDVLTGINRPGRWPELSSSRVAGALGACRSWADHVVVDVAASLESDEEIVSDLDGPRRNAATLAALQSADVVVAVLSADPVGVARFLRAHAELRAIIGPAKRVVVVANRLRPGTLGIDARGQVRRTLERFAGIEDVWFVPLDPRSADAAVLAARPVSEAAPRSPLAAAVRRLVGEAVAPVARTEPRPTRRSGRVSRRQARLA